MSTHAELDRISAEYARRDTNARLDQRYTLFSPASLFAVQSRERALLAVLRAQGIASLADRRILDLGCGGGGELRRFLSYGANPRNLCGLDLLPERVTSARHLSPHLGFAQGDGGCLPFPDDAFDIVSQFTVFSSILAPTLRGRVAAEMLRVLKPDGLAVWYDFWLNPANPQTHGIRPSEIRRLFPGCKYEFHRITLAPPIARRVVPISWLAAYLLEGMPFLRTHYLAVIRRPEDHHAR